MAYKKKRKAADSIWELDGGGYLVDVTKPESNDQRVRKKLKTLGEAKHFKSWVLEKWRESPEWMPKKHKKTDARRLDVFIKEWYKYYGKKLSSGKKQRNKLYEIAEAINNPHVHKVTRAIFTEYRAERMGQVSIKTINNEHGYFCSLFNMMQKLGRSEHPNPIEGLEKLSYSQPELAYLEEEEIERLLIVLNSIDEEVALIAELCLSTGARWGEAQSLEFRRVKNNTVYYTKTKTDLNRHVGIDSDLYQRLRARGEGLLFRQAGGCEKVFKRGVIKAGIDLPKGQCTHVLRHTFATHFLFNCKRSDGLLLLQNILGHTNIKTTERYLKIIQSKDSGAEILNPVAVLKQRQSKENTILNAIAASNINIPLEQASHIIKETFNIEFLSLCDEKQIVSILHTLLANHKTVIDKVISQGEIIHNPESINPVKTMRERQKVNAA